ncbi:MAG: sulfite exporter TauE/SafE family protein [Promethearchaeota archaeon]
MWQIWLIFVFLVLIGLAVGFISGFFGVGACFLMVPSILIVLYYGFDFLDYNSIKIAFGTNMSVVVITALSGHFGHESTSPDTKFPNWDWNRFALGVAIGSVIGSIFAYLVPGMILKIVFAILCFIGAWRFLTAKPRPVTQLPKNSASALITAGLGAGSFAHFAGIGGGLVYVPTLNTILKYPIKRTISISLKTMVVGSSVGAISFILLGASVQESSWPLGTLGYFNVICFIALSLTSVPMARVGAKVSEKLSSKKFKPLLAVLYTFIGIWLLLTTLGVIPLTPPSTS